MPDSKPRVARDLSQTGFGLRGLTKKTDGKALDLSANEEAKYIPLTKIVVNPNQPRRTADEAALQELADDIAARGVLQPILVRPVGDGTYQIVAGERRFLASQRAGKDEIPAIVKRDMDDREARYVSLVENVQRLDLSAVDEGRYFGELTTLYNLSVRDIAAMINKSAPYVQSKINAARAADGAGQPERVAVAKDSEKGNKRSDSVRLLQNSQRSTTTFHRAIRSFASAAARATADLSALAPAERESLDGELAAAEEAIRAVRAQLREGG